MYDFTEDGKVIIYMEGNPKPKRQSHKTFLGPSIEIPKDSRNHIKIDQPPLSTIDFKCPECNAKVKQWCKGEPEHRWHIVPICEARKRLHAIIYKRYITGVQNYTIPFALSYKEKEKLIQEMIASLLKENL